MRQLRPPTASDTRALLPGDSRQFRHKTRDSVRSRAQIRQLPRAASGAKYSVFAATSRSGETRTRTGDTTIFSRVLYQLSYLAEREQASASPPTQSAAGA